MAWWGGKASGSLAFVAIVGLVAGGLGWVTASALRLEREQLDDRAAAVRAVRLRLALWRLDSRVGPPLAREDARPFNHYSALYAPPLTLTSRGESHAAGSVLEPSPLLQADLPSWMLLHFQADAGRDGGWTSPQVPPPGLLKLAGARPLLMQPNVTSARARALCDLEARLSLQTLVLTAREHVAPATTRESTLRLARRNADLSESIANLAPQQSSSPVQGRAAPANSTAEPFAGRASQRVERGYAMNSLKGGNQEKTKAGTNNDVTGTEVSVSLTAMVPVWLPLRSGPERLALVRLVEVENQEVCQGVLLDADALRETLESEIADLFPSGRLLPVREPDPDRAESVMATLPFRLDPGTDDPVVADTTWTPLRFGLVLAWLAAVVALLAVGLGGWSLVGLSERRARFVSAVTHELRTPLTALRLYLDMLVGGMVPDAARREEYLLTLHAEAERLHRLVANVLDFARLERRRPTPVREPVSVADLIARVCTAWQRHCDDAGKSLVTEMAASYVEICTDARLVEQVLGILIDNACKYSRGAADPRVWLRFRVDGRAAVFEVADRGPGVPARERRAIFRAFRRGRSADATAGGVGLGLALARRWTNELGGSLVLNAAAEGACFRMQIPAAAVGR